MNQVLDVLLLRRPAIRYVSPPVCPVIMSGSGSSLMLMSVEAPFPPNGLQFLGQCGKYLTWNDYPDADCFILSLSTTGFTGPFTTVTECLPANSVNVCSPGYYRVTTLTADGVESLPGPVVLNTGGYYAVPIPKNPGAVRFNVYKNPDQTNPNGTFILVLSAVGTGAVEACYSSGCFCLQVITPNGISALSTPICRQSTTGCCTPQNCLALGYAWDSVQCSCVPGVSELVGPQANFCVGVVYSSQITVIGGIPPYTWSLVSGSLPPGVVLHTGLFTGNTAPINGTPTAPGVYAFSVQVADSAGSHLTESFTLNGVGVAQYPVLPPATTDTAYSEQLTSAGGTAPYLFTLDSGSLPSGLTLSSSGLISGTSNFFVTNSFTVGVLDTYGNKCDTPLSLSVNYCPVVSSYPTVSWTSSFSAAPDLQGIVLDTTRRNVWMMRDNSVSVGVGYISSITKSLVGEYGQQNNIPHGTGVQIGYDPVNDVLVFVDQNPYWSRIDPSTITGFVGLMPSNIQAGEGGVKLRLGVDTKRGHVIAVQQTSAPGYFEVVQIQKSSATILFDSGAFSGIQFGNAAYSDVADKFVLSVSNGNPPLYYVNPVTYAATPSSISSITAASPVQVFPLPGTPYVAFHNTLASTTVVNVVTDTVYTTFGDTYTSVYDMAYNSCTGNLYVSTNSGVFIYNIASKLLVSNPAVRNYAGLVFDPAAGLVYGSAGGTTSTPTIYTL